MDVKSQAHALMQGCAEIISANLLAEKLDKAKREKRSLVVKAGFDPSSPDIHLGHTVLLSKLKQFQEFGHVVTLIIGDATARVGDPSGRNKTRPLLTEAEIKANAKTYQQQVFRILDPKKTKVVFNNRWFQKMKFSDVLALTSNITVSQILQRDDFQKRMGANTPISLLELFYPLMQAYDSVQIEADIELGGTDQKFNLLLGRELQKVFGLEQQVVMTFPLLVGLDGVNKMSKSLGNHIGVLHNAKSMFGKIMSLSDVSMFHYYDLLTDVPSNNIKEKIQAKTLHPKQAKVDLAMILCERFHDKKKASAAKDEFEKVFTQKEHPTTMQAFDLNVATLSILKLLLHSKLISSGNQARRMLKQGAVSIDGQTIEDVQADISVKRAYQILKVGKRKFIRFKRK